MNTNKRENSLSKFKLYYERLESEMSKKAKSKTLVSKKAQLAPKKQPIALKKHINDAIASVRVNFDNMLRKLKIPHKVVKKATKVQKKLAREQQLRGILGIGALFVVVSIAYSSYVIFSGVDSSVSRIMLIPQVIFAIYTLIKAFSKIYK